MALLSHSNLGDSPRTSSTRMRDAFQLPAKSSPELEVDGEMHADAALSEASRGRVFPNSKLGGAANLLVMPTLDAAHISFNLLKTVTESVTIGPILLGAARSAHILTPAASVRRIINMTALAVAETQDTEVQDGESAEV